MARVARRTKRRMSCSLIVGRQRFSGVVLDLSASGLFVQTTAKPHPREAVAVELGIPGRREPIRLDTSVARLFVVPAQLLTVAQGGVGLRIRNAPEAYFELLQRVQGERARAGAAADADAAGEPQRFFRVRITQIGRSRTRTLRVAAESPEQAMVRAAAESGEGWKVLEATEEAVG